MGYPNSDVCGKIVIHNARGQQHVESFVVHRDLLLDFKYISLVPISKWITSLWCPRIR